MAYKYWTRLQRYRSNILYPTAESYFDVKLESYWSVLQNENRLTETSIAFHLDKLTRGFADGTLCEDTVENAGETHFLSTFHNGLVLDLLATTTLSVLT